MEAFIGTVLPVAFNFAPRGWVFCSGQTMNVVQNTALFSLIGNIYGGNQQVFGIPDLRGRVIVGSQEQGPGLNNVTQGQLGGANTVTGLSNGSVSITLTAANLPAHTHPIAGSVITIAIPACSTSGSANTDTPGASTILTKGTVVSGPVNTTSKQYTTAKSDTSLLPFDVKVAASNTDPNTGGQPIAAPFSVTTTVNVMQPFLGLNYIMCVEGIFPSKN